ncbi:MAG: hypothetical protein ACI9VT_001473 [Psychroserpens sp.]|jgi:hypothetical protein
MKPFNSTKFIALSSLLLYSNATFAYLDPGSGSAIVGVITATIGSIWFSLKSLFYRLKGQTNANDIINIDEKSIVLFSEGKAYWGTFKLLVDELIQQKITFRYFTLDMHDPALEIDNKYMQSKRLSLGSINMAEINNVKAKCVISTTPNIGCPSYPVKKSPQNDRLIHVFHHVGDISIYKKNSLDFYDEVILVGDFQELAIRELEKLRGLKEKTLVSLGALYLDELVKNKFTPPEETKANNKPTVLIGSSWGKKGCLQNYGTEFINQLANAGFRVIIRPHPQSVKSETEFLNQCKKSTIHPNITWDSAVSPSQSMYESDILISDTSSLRFDYAFLYEKPIITLEIDNNNLSEFEHADLDSNWYKQAALQIGAVVDQNSIAQISDIVSSTLAIDMSSDIKAFKEKTVVNFGVSAPKIVQYVDKVNRES